MIAEEIDSRKDYIFEEYLKLEENNDLRYEYYGGKVVLKTANRSPIVIFALI